MERPAGDLHPRRALAEAEPRGHQVCVSAREGDGHEQDPRRAPDVRGAQIHRRGHHGFWPGQQQPQPAAGDRRDVEGCLLVGPGAARPLRERRLCLRGSLPEHHQAHQRRHCQKEQGGIELQEVKVLVSLQLELWGTLVAQRLRHLPERLLPAGSAARVDPHRSSLLFVDSYILSVLKLEVGIILSQVI